MVAALDGVEGGDGSAATLGVAAKASEPAAVAVSAAGFFVAAPTPHSDLRELAIERESRRPGPRRRSLRRQHGRHKWQRSRERRTAAPHQSCRGSSVKWRE